MWIFIQNPIWKHIFHKTTFPLKCLPMLIDVYDSHYSWTRSRCQMQMPRNHYAHSGNHWWLWNHWKDPLLRHYWNHVSNCINLSRKWFLSLFLFVSFWHLLMTWQSPPSALYQLCDTSINCVYVRFVVFSVTLAEDGARRCLNPAGRKAMFFVNCWNR